MKLTCYSLKNYLLCPLLLHGFGDKKPARWAAQRRSVTLEEPEDANLNPAVYERSDGAAQRSVAEDVAH